MMKHLISVFLTLFMCLCGVVSPAIAQRTDDLEELSSVLRKFHCNPKEANEKLSDDVFRMLMNTADPSRMIFKREDVDLLRKLSNSAMEMQSVDRSGFLKNFTALYDQRLRESIAALSKVCETTVDLFSEDTLFLAGADLSGFPDDDAQLLKHWDVWIKLEVLKLIFDESAVGDSLAGLSRVKLMETKKNYQERVKMKNVRRMQRILNHPAGLESYCRSMFLNALCHCYDPHTEYFSPDEMKIFSSQVTNEGYYFGFYLAEDDAGSVYISGMKPGGPAWKTNALNKGDQLIAMQWEGQEKIDLTFVSIEEVSSLIKASIEKPLLLTVRKSDGKVITVKLVKAKSISKENIVKSFLLAGSNNIGYIYLPGFYSNAENDGSPGCASDVALELLKLNKEGIQGLILDLRQNGGGSVKEAVDLSGIFVDNGPVCVFKTRNGKPFTLKDVNMGTAYSGPLIILVDGYSASASEIVAACLQDYQRAIIVGAPTFGKATGQGVIPVDSTLNPDLPDRNKKQEDRGFVKVTMEEIFRITGASHQNTGVTPDIVIPDFSTMGQETEESMEFAFANSRIEKKTYYTPLSPLPLDTLRLLSQRRIMSDSLFGMIDKYNQWEKQSSSMNYLIVAFSLFEKLNIEEELMLDAADSLLTAQPQVFRIENLQYDMPLLQSDEIFKANNDADIERLQSDFILKETFNIINDLILLQNK